jgi:hypothetical protein
MKFATGRPDSDPENAACKLIELGMAIGAASMTTR